MREPSPRTRFLASPPVFFGAWGLSLWLGYQWMLDNSVWPVLAVLALPMAAIMEAEREVKAYKLWKREWDAMSGVTVPTRWPQRLGVVLGLCLAALLFQLGEQSGRQAVIGALVVMILLMMLAMLLVGMRRIWRTLRRRRDSFIHPVTACVRQPFLPVPTLRDAYRDLPDHCALVLGAPA